MEQSKHGQGVTSVVVHHQPGGQSSLQLGGGYGDVDDRFGDKKNKGAVGQPVAAAEEEKKEQVEGEEEEEKKEETTEVLAAGQKKQQAAVGGAGQPMSGETSMKVRAPPGGASSITF